MVAQSCHTPEYRSRLPHTTNAKHKDYRSRGRLLWGSTFQTYEYNCGLYCFLTNDHPLSMVANNLISDKQSTCFKHIR